MESPASAPLPKPAFAIYLGTLCDGPVPAERDESNPYYLPPDEKPNSKSPTF